MTDRLSINYDTQYWHTERAKQCARGLSTDEIISSLVMYNGSDKYILEKELELRGGKQMNWRKEKDPLWDLGF